MASNVVLAMAEDEDIAETIRMVLEEEPTLEVVTAKNGEEALRLARRCQPSLVVVDWVEWPAPPRPEDAAVVRALKRDPLTREVPVVALVYSSYAGREAVEAGCTGWIEKPFEDIEALLAKVRQYLRRGGKPTERAIGA